MWKAEAESENSLVFTLSQLLQSSDLWTRMFREVMLSWDNPASCVSLLSEAHKFFCWRKREMVWQDDIYH